MRVLFLACLLVLIASTSGFNTLLRIKGMKLLGVKFLALKTPLLAPIAVKAAVPAALAHAKAHMAKKVAAIASVKHALVKLPLAFVSMKVGAVTGAYSGAKAGLEAAEHAPQHPVPETQVPSDARKAPAYIPPAPVDDGPPTPAYTPSSLADTPPAPAYTPTSQALERKRRETDEDEQLNDEDIREAFTFMSDLDKKRCVNRALCEIAVDPSIARGNGMELLAFMNSLSDDTNAPWVHHKSAVNIGSKLKSRETCVKEYPDCDQNTEDLVEKALATVE